MHGQIGALLELDPSQVTPSVELLKQVLALKGEQKSRRHMDWNIVLVVDVSGSMEPSVIYSAMS